MSFIFYILVLEPEHGQKNEYYLPAINNALKRLLRKLTMWGNVMTKYFLHADVASNSNVENHFKDLKTIYFNTRDERIRLDEFLVQHHSFISGIVKLSIAINKIYILLDDVPVHVDINERQYVLLAVIEYVSAGGIGAIGHYKAHCYRLSSGKFQCYDDLFSEIQKNHSKNISPHATIYTLQSDDI